MGRRPGLSVRAKLALSYAAVAVLVGGLLLAVVWVFLLRYVPDGPLTTPRGFIPNRGDLERAFVPRARLAMIFLLVGSLVGGWWLAGRMLAPLDRITRATRLAARGALDHRIALPGRQDELRELADSFDTMLARLEAHVAEQRRFAANASHELRTPLATMQAMIEVARTDPDRDVDALLTRLHEINARAIELTESLLLLSRAEQAAFVPEPVDLSLLAEEALEELLPLAERRGLQVAAGGDPAPTLGSPALLVQLASNLVLNAIVHNVPGGTVQVRTRRAGEVVELVVENTGPVVADDLVARLVEPFQRGSERVRTEQRGDHAGVGLGLAIVRTITRAHRGRLRIRARHGGGLVVQVELPTADVAAARARPARVN